MSYLYVVFAVVPLIVMFALSFGVLANRIKVDTDRSVGDRLLAGFAFLTIATELLLQAIKYFY